MNERKRVKRRYIELRYLFIYGSNIYLYMAVIYIYLWSNIYLFMAVNINNNINTDLNEQSLLLYDTSTSPRIENIKVDIK